MPARARKAARILMKKYIIITVILRAITIVAFGTLSNSFAMKHALEKQLIDAVKMDDTARISKLINNAHENIDATKLNMPLYVAIDFRNINSIRALLAAGADPLLQQGLPFTNLRYAISNNMADELKELLCKVTPTRLNQIDPHGYTELIHAIFVDSYLNIIVLLLAAGANPWLQTTIELFGKPTKVTALDYAKRSNRKNIVTLLENLYITPQEVRSMLGKVWALKNLNHTILKDVVNTHIKPALVEDLSTQKMAKIQDDLPSVEWAQIDKTALQKALKINIKASL